MARSLHWLMAAMIGVQLTVGWVAEEMARSPEKVTWMTGHKSLGVTILLFAVLRTWNKTLDPAPLPPAGTPRWEIHGATISHWTLYFLMLALPLSGWLVADTAIFPWKLWWLVPAPDILASGKELHEIGETLHKLLVWSLVALLSLHILAALRHHFIKRNDVLRRMWRG
ncbi:MAG: cytochrome b [Gammaproteobacteria bacterium]|nr:cytochrome b [Gammaproteobacteria bacterium]